MKRCPLWEYVWLVVACSTLLVSVAMVAQPPMPSVPKRLFSPRATVSPLLQNKDMVKTVVTEQQLVVGVTNKVVSLAADFSATVWALHVTNGITYEISTNFLAFIDVRTSLTNAWVRLVTTHYPYQGGTLQANYTNTTKQFYFRAGYSFPVWF